MTMKKVLFVIGLVALSQTAYATDVAQETASWAIKTAARPVGVAADRPVIYNKLLATCSEDDVDVCPYNGTAVSFNTSWSYVKATNTYDAPSNTNYYALVFVQEPYTSWPTFPSTITAYHEGTGYWSGDTAFTTVDVVNHPDPNGSGEPTIALPNFTTSVPLVRDGSTVTHHLEVNEWACRTLPTGTYIDGITTCKKANNTSHTGLTISIYEMGASDMMCVKADGRTVTNASTCPISKNGVMSNIPVPVTVEPF